MDDLKNFNSDELKEIIKNFGFEQYRAKQVYEWIYRKGVMAIDEMKNLPENLRQKLKQNYTLSSLEIKYIQESKDGTKKILFELKDGYKIESVLIPDDDRTTLCISSQAGCGCGCSFCATGKIGFKRNLKTAEIIEEFILAEKENKKKIDNIVFMGMGEPLLNWDNVKKAIMIISDKNGKNFSQTRITVSTIGIVPKIKEIAESDFKFYLAISLIAADDKLRSELVPFNEKYGLEEIIKISRYYNKKTEREITYEYVMLKDKNDSDEDAKKIIKILKGIKCKINLIPYNMNEKFEFKKPETDRVFKFQEILKEAGFKVFIRKEKGSDISAACGQLAGK